MIPNDNDPLDTEKRIQHPKRNVDILPGFCSSRPDKHKVSNDRFNRIIYKRFVGIANALHEMKHVMDL